MLVTTTQLSTFSGVYPESTDLQIIYINSASDVIKNYVGFDVEEQDTIPDIFRLVCLEIATLMQQEESENLGVNSKSFNESGSRSFLNVVDYTKYLQRLDSYRTGSALKV